MLRSEAKPASIIPKAKNWGIPSAATGLIDPQVLNTLPVREFRAGMAEVIKYIIWDLCLPRWNRVIAWINCATWKATLLQEILSVPVKPKLMSSAKMKKKQGSGQFSTMVTPLVAVESLTGYRLFNHGEAVAIGMVAAGQLAVELQFWDRAAGCVKQL